MKQETLIVKSGIPVVYGGEDVNPVLYLIGGTHPDHDSINTFRRRFLPQLEPLFVQILQIAHGLGILQLGDESLDGTKIQANASKHKALSWAYAEQREAPLRAEVRTLLRRAEAAEGPGSPDLDLPAELQRREDRLQKIAEVKAEIARRARVRGALADSGQPPLAPGGLQLQHR